jgi:hypothetical protein
MDHNYTMKDDRANRDLRVSAHDGDMQELMADYPKLSRTEILDAITRAGPIRADVEAELRRLSSRKT